MGIGKPRSSLLLRREGKLDPVGERGVLESHLVKFSLVIRIVGPSERPNMFHVRVTLFMGTVSVPVATWAPFLYTVTVFPFTVNAKFCH